MITKALWIILKYLVIFFINKALLLFIGIESSANINLLIGFISILLSFLEIKTLFKIMIISICIVLFNQVFMITTDFNIITSVSNFIINIHYREILFSDEFKAFLAVLLIIVMVSVLLLGLFLLVDVF